MRERTRLSRRGWTVLVSGVLVLVFVLLGTLVRVPYVVLGPGPTFDILGKVDGEPVVRVDGNDTYDNEGVFRMVTVAISEADIMDGTMCSEISIRATVALLTSSL